MPRMGEIMPPEVRAKISATKKGKPAPWMVGVKNPVHNPVVRAKFKAVREEPLPVELSAKRKEISRRLALIKESEMRARLKETTLCVCGCGTTIPKYVGNGHNILRQFVSGHQMQGQRHYNFKGPRDLSETKSCECGCGQQIFRWELVERFGKLYARKEKRFVSGHNGRGKKKPWFSEWVRNNQHRIPKLKGAAHPFWKGGVTPEIQKIRKSPEYREWREKVYRRDNWSCTVCGKKCKRDIVAHHIKPFADFPELRFDISNGITLCRACHKKRHPEIGLDTRFGQNALTVQ